MFNPYPTVDVRFFLCLIMESKTTQRSSVDYSIMVHNQFSSLGFPNCFEDICMSGSVQKDSKEKC